MVGMQGASPDIVEHGRLIICRVTLDHLLGFHHANAIIAKPAMKSTMEYVPAQLLALGSQS
jgi:hypothetical protein